MHLTMETIRAAHNLTIELGPTTWRLFNGTPSADSGAVLPLVEARQEGVFCIPAFAQARQLPANGQLMPADIARVVVGWAAESHNWHLGLLLAAHPNSDFKMRWCGLASWPSGPASEHVTQAKLAGQSLARILDRPFHLIPAAPDPVNPLSETQPLQATVRMFPAESIPKAEEPALQAPPFEFEASSLVAVPKGYVWQHNSKSLFNLVVRAFGFAALAILFFILGIGAQTSGLAAINPQWLPWSGLLVGGVLTVLAGYNFWKLLTVADVIIDHTDLEVRCQNRFSGRVRWRVPFDSVGYLLLTQTPARALGRKNKDAPMRIGQDIWLHLYDGRRFWLLAELSQVEGTCYEWETVKMIQKQPGRRALLLAHYDTPAHHAAAFLARTLGTELWQDIRLKFDL